MVLAAFEVYLCSGLQLKNLHHQVRPRLADSLTGNCSVSHDVLNCPFVLVRIILARD